MHGSRTQGKLFAALITSNRYRLLAFLLATAAILPAPNALAQAPDDPRLLWKEATLYRDEFGTPHVYAHSPRAMAFAFGYAQAEDQLRDLLFAYRVANGRAAEVEGEAYAESDIFALRMGHAEFAEAALAEADPAVRDLCEGFALGVNVWMAEHPDRAPDWAVGARPSDVLALLHCYLTAFAPFDLPGHYRRPLPARTGNAWAVAPERSASGEAMLVINPHTDYDGPFQWYEGHLDSLDYRMAGATLVGLPVILQGHNGVLGWALSPNRPDIADVYLESPPEATPGGDPASMFGAPQFLQERYLMQTAQQIKSFYVLTDAGMEERPVLVQRTPRGPIVGQDIGGLDCSYRVAGYFNYGSLRQFLDMGRAQDLDEFQAALHQRQVHNFHIVYADDRGNIQYLYNANVPNKQWVDPPKPDEQNTNRPPNPEEHAALMDWTVPAKSTDLRYEWGDMVGLEYMPSLLNPPSGYVQACGNPPWLTTQDSGMKAEDWPAWLVHDRDTYRAKRVRDLLGQGERSFEDMQAMLYDTVVPFAMFAVPTLIGLARDNPGYLATAHPDLSVGVDMLGKWNAVAEPNSEAMTLFHVWWSTMRNMTPGLSEDALFAAFAAQSPAMKEQSLRAVSEAAMALRNMYQTLSVPWGEVHVLRRGRRDMPIGGAESGEPIFVASDRVYGQEKWFATYGYGFAMVVKFGDSAEAVSIVPFGASRSPRSSHYADQLELFTERRFKRARFELTDVQRFVTRATGHSIQLRSRHADAMFNVHGERRIDVAVEENEEPTHALPAGLGAFSPQVKLVDVGATADRTEIFVQVPPELCAPERVGALGVYAYREDAWHALPDQELDPDTGVFYAEDNRAGEYVVLGPAELRLMAGKTQPTVPMPAAPETPTIPQPTVAEVTAAPQPGSPTAAPATNTTMEPAQVTRPTEHESTVIMGRQATFIPVVAKGEVHAEAESSVGVQLKETMQAPAPLPDGMAAFTPFVTVSYKPTRVVVKVSVALQVGADACADEQLGHLALYTYAEGTGWQLLEGAAADGRTWSGTDGQARTYAVLGPEVYRLGGEGQTATP
jgi:acyl-homoserine-lactone acylase